MIGWETGGGGASDVAGSIGRPAAAPAAIAAIEAVRSPAAPARIASRQCSSTVISWSASTGRSAAFLLSVHRIVCSSSGGIFGLICDGGTGASETCLSAIVTACSPSNGTRPVSIS